MSTWFRRVWHLLNRSHHERELVREMSEHRESMHDPSKFGDTHRLLEYSRDAWGWNWLDDAAQDLKQGVRSLRRAPVFVITATLIVSFGIGLNLTLYQMANVALLRGPNVKDPETLARFQRRAPGRGAPSVPYPLAEAVARQNQVLSAVLLASQTPVGWGEDVRIVNALFVSSNWFTELGGSALLGRVFSEAADTIASPPVAVVSEQFWESQLGANPSVIGSVVRINRRPVTIAGVVERKFTGVSLDQPDVWLVLNQRESVFPDSAFLHSWEGSATAFYGRLKPGVTPAAARESMRALMTGLRQQYPDHIWEQERLDPAMASANFFDERERPRILGVLSIIGLLTTLALAVAAANVGNLVLSRATGRSRELGVRVALGATRFRIVRQLVVEAVPLTILGALGGILLAGWAADAIAATGNIAETISFAPDWRAALVSVLLAAVALMVIGAVPAWKVSRQGLLSSIRDGGHQMSMNLDKAYLRRLLMTAQVCGSCVILVVSAMMARTLQRVLSNDLGFAYEQAAALEAGLRRYGFAATAARDYWDEVKRRVSQHPEVAAVSLALAPPLSGRVHEEFVEDVPALEVVLNRVEPSFFGVMEIPLLTGRTFAPADDPDTTVIVGRALAVAMFGSVDVIGRGFPQSNPASTIVGVAADAHAMNVGAVDTSELYRPLTDANYVEAVLIARGRGDAAALAPILREAASVDSRILPAVMLLRESFERRVEGTRVSSIIAMSTAAITVLIACLGIFGVVSYGAGLRVKEFGIRVALGAKRASIVRLAFGNVVWPTVVGAVVGIAAGNPIGQALTNGPIQIQPADPAAYAGALLLFGLAAAVAAAVPAIRVLQSDPVKALRES
jgi:putative ABC transport system permease protein